MFNGAYQLDPVLGYVPAIPEPFWYRSWRTWFCVKPTCYECVDKKGRQPLIFKTRKEYDTHYVLTHIPPAKE